MNEANRIANARAEIEASEEVGRDLATVKEFSGAVQRILELDRAEG